MDPTWIILIISTVLLLGGASIWQKHNWLSTKGEKATAIVFSNVQREGGLYYPVLRFVTKKKVWITHELSVGFTPPMSEGKKLKILYDPENPFDLVLNYGIVLVLLPRIMVALGIGGIVLWGMLYLEFL